VCLGIQEGGEGGGRAGGARNIQAEIIEKPRSMVLVSFFSDYDLSTSKHHAQYAYSFTEYILPE
jgi:hypothetical protein